MEGTRLISHIDENLPGSQPGGQGDLSLRRPSISSLRHTIKLSEFFLLRQAGGWFETYLYHELCLSYETWVYKI